MSIEPEQTISDARILAETPRAGAEAASARASRAPLRPGAWLLAASPLHWVSLGLGSGLSPIAPGTVGTLWAWAAWLLLSPWIGPVTWGYVLLLGTLVGWWSCTATARALRTADPSAVVWDEVLAFWLILWVISPAPWTLQCAAFLIFRLFDIAKPGPVGWADRLFKTAPGALPGWRQGWGILWDDFVAAFCTLVVLALWKA
jgi:phosphatidylglycerophosphatase A